MKQINKQIINWCGKYYVMDDAESNVVEYGVQLMLNTSIKIIIILLVGVVLGYLKEVVVSMWVFGCIRYFAGGYHCKTDIGCLGVMLAISLSPMLFFDIEERISWWIWSFIIVYSMYQTVRYAPRNSKVNPIYDMQILSRKRKGSVIVVGIAIMVICFNSQNALCWLVAIPMFVEAVAISPIFYREERMSMGGVKK